MSDYGALLRCKPLVWLDHTARLVPHIASRLLGLNREVIPSHILTAISVNPDFTHVPLGNAKNGLFSRYSPPVGQSSASILS